MMGRTAAATFSAPTPTPDHRGQAHRTPGHQAPQLATTLTPAFNGTWSREQRSTLLLGCPSPWCERGVYRWANLLPFPHENPLPRRLSPPRRFTPDRRQLHTPTTPLDPHQERADGSYLDQTTRTPSCLSLGMAQGVASPTEVQTDKTEHRAVCTASETADLQRTAAHKVDQNSEAQQT